ncbi:MAG: aspartate/glutamate racemase family protein [Clostridia bacterium]
MRILIINPNSSDDMAVGIQKNALAYANGEFEVDTLSTPGAPEYIDFYVDAAVAAPGMIKLVKENEDKYDAFIIACHCDPNLDLLKEVTDKPVVGIGESSMKIASMLGHSFSVVSAGKHSIPNKQAIIQKYGLTGSLASVRGPKEDCTDNSPEGPYVSAAIAAVEEDLAEVIVLGCAGLIGVEDALRKVIDVPVLDGVTCALIIAEGLVKAGYSTSKIRRYSGRE